MAHACELETSIYLALAPELVQMDKAEKDITSRRPTTSTTTGSMGRAR